MATQIIKAEDTKFYSSEEVAEFILDVMQNGNQELGVNDAGTFIDWLHNYLTDIAYGD